MTESLQIHQEFGIELNSEGKLKLPLPDKLPTERLGLFTGKFWKFHKLNDGTFIFNNSKFITKDYNIFDVIGFDTETYQGTCRLLCRSDGLIKHTSIEPTFKECLDFMFYNASKSLVWRFFFNIDFDINAILKTIDLPPFCKESVIRAIDKGLVVQFDKYSIQYIKGVMFIIKKGKKKVVITDLFRIFRMSLNKASLDFLKNEQKDKINAKMLNKSIKYWNDNIKNIIKYCIQDCKLVKKLGLEFLKYLKKSEIAIPKYLCSPASLSKADFRLNCYIPKLSQIPKFIIQIGYDSYYGGRFEVLKRGTFEKMYNYDINSEYPDIIRKLPSFKYGAWKKIKEIPEKECFSYFHVILDIPQDNYISTIPLRYKGMIRFPNGAIQGWFTWYDLDLMRDFIVEILEGYIYLPSKFEYYPFKKRIEQLYNLKAEYKDKNKIMYMIFKLAMNALYGCFFEKHKRYKKDGKSNSVVGVLFNPVYASFITAFGRWSIIKPIWTIKEKIIGFHTDSILSMIPLDKYLNKYSTGIGKGLGQWSLEASGKGYIINTGMYQINDIKGNIVKTRGIPKKYIKDWFKFAKKNKRLKKKKFYIKRMVKLSQALIQFKDKGGIDMVNIMFDNQKTVNINSDKKRHWYNEFISFNRTLTENIDSLPYTAISNEVETYLYPNIEVAKEICKRIGTYEG